MVLKALIGILILFLICRRHRYIIVKKVKELTILYSYCNKWKLVVNDKGHVFRKCGMTRRNKSLIFTNEIIEIVKSFTYLGVVFKQVVLFNQHLIQ